MAKASSKARIRVGAVQPDLDPSASIPGARGISSSRARWAAALLVAGYLSIGLLSGAPDSPLVPALPPGVAVPGWLGRGASWLRLDRLSRVGLTGVAIVMLAALVVAFLALVVEARRSHASLLLIALTTMVSLGILVAAPLLFSRDVYSYEVYGRMFALGNSNPYLRPPVLSPGDPMAAVISPYWTHTRSVYGPAFTLISGGVVRTWAGSPEAIIRAFKVLAAVAVAAAAALAWLAGRRRGPGTAATAAVVVGLNPVLVVHAVGGGHGDGLLAALVAGALLLALRVGDVRERLSRAARTDRLLGPAAIGTTLLLVVAVLVKVVMAPLLVAWLGWLGSEAIAPLALSGTAAEDHPLDGTTRGRPAAPPLGRFAYVLGAHAAVAVLAAVALFAPFWAGWRTFRSLVVLGSVQGWASGPALVARGARAAGRALAGASAGNALSKATVVAFLALYAVAFMRLLRTARQRPVQWTWLAVMLLLALSLPYLLPWYAAWFLPLLVVAEDATLLWTGLAAGAILAVTGVPAEAGTNEALWRNMLLAVHYAAAPLMLVLLGVATRHVATRTGSGGDRRPVSS